MIRTDKVIVVEGKYDAIKLANFVEATIITTDGFGIFKDEEKQKLLLTLAEKRGLIVLTDSDSAGFMIRNFIGNKVPKEYITDVYIPDIFGKEKRKAQPSAEGKLGVEGMPEKVLAEASSAEGIEAVSIATRPDCLGPDILEVLAKQAKKMPLFVELGLQTASDVTGEFINRCYKTSDYADAVKALKDIGANVITHIIFGLPGETRDMMMDTVKLSVKCGSDGYKFTCLYVLGDTPLEVLYRENKVEILGMEEYFDIVEAAIKLLPEKAVVHRFTGDGPKKILIAPEWTKNKRQVVNYINRRFGL